PEDKKETTKRKPAIKKKAVMTGVWPCKINGCNKQFAREADLKRHQRTTKLHSLPGFACPQCDAAFTRTDALRRHQKSRHNGIIVEASEDAKDGADDDAESSESQSKSRSATPSSKGKERSTRTRPDPNHPNPAGPSSYYRQHTATTTYITRPPIMDPQYAQIGLPTSATRLNLATNWGYPQPWSDGAPGHVGPVSYQTMPPMFYYPHYRPNGGMVQPPEQQTQLRNDQKQDTQDRATNMERPRTSSPIPHASDATVVESEIPTKSMNPTLDTLPSEISPIDPALDSDNSTLTEQQVLEITQAAMKAVLEAEAGTSNSTTSNVGSASPFSQTEKDTNKEEIDTMHVYGGTLKRPEPMAHMLTEDGEPMLNPAELLTQESLASPPPS
ncbi:hypothetical protein BDZ94DRAFT_1151150, partial [Collybia nuda]